jgi:hypothetical protein
MYSRIGIGDSWEDAIAIPVITNTIIATKPAVFDTVTTLPGSSKCTIDTSLVLRRRQIG